MEPSRLLGRASVAGLALCLVALMILSVPSGTAMGISSAASTGVAAPANAYAPDAYMPDPQAVGNVTLNTVNLGAGQMDYPTTVGTSTTWHAPAGVSLNTGHVANPIVADNASAAVVPGVLQGDAFPHTTGGFLSGGPNASAAYCATYGAHGCAWWNNSHVWSANDSMTSTQTAGAGGMYTHITNATASTGQPEVIIAMNTSAAGQSANAMTDIATAGLTIPTSALVAAGYTQTSYTYLTLSYYVTTSEAATTMVTPFIGGNYAWGAPTTTGPTPPYTLSSALYIPSSNLSTQAIVPCENYGKLYTVFLPGELVATKTSVAANSACGSPAVGVPLDPMAGAVYSTQGSSGEELVSYPVSDSAYCWISPGVTCSGLTEVTSIEFGVLIESEGTNPTANWVTVTITGLSLTTAPVSLGQTASDGWTCAVASGGCAAKYGQYGGDSATLDAQVGLPTIESGVVWHNTSASLPIEGTTLVPTAGWTTGATTSLQGYTVPVPLVGFAPSWGAAGWLNGSAVTEAWAQSATTLTNVSVTPFAGPSGTGGLINYRYNFSWPSSSDLSYIGVPCTLIGCPVDTVFVVDDVVSNTTYLTAQTDEANVYKVSLFNAVSSGAFPGAGTEVVRLHTQPWNPRFVVSGSIPTSCVVGHYCGPTGQDPENATVVYSISYNASDFAAIVGSAPPPPPPPPPPTNTTGGFLGGSISVEGTWILAGLVILAGVIALVSWASYEGGERKGKGMRRGGRGRRGTLRAPSLRRSRLGMAGVRHARYEGRTAKAYVHEGSGIGWFVLAAVLGFGAFFWLSTSGVLGFALSQVAAAALVIVLLVVMVLLIIVWESTKTVNG